MEKSTQERYVAYTLISDQTVVLCVGAPGEEADFVKKLGTQVINHMNARGIDENGLRPHLHEHLKVVTRTQFDKWMYGDW